MNINYEKLFSHVITTTLLGMAVYSHSPAFAVVAVVSFGVSMAYDLYNKLVVLKEQKPGINEEAKRALQDMNVRIARLEHGVATRGF